MFNCYVSLQGRVCDGYDPPCDNVSLVQGGPLNTLLSTSADGFATIPGVCEVKIDGLSWDFTHLAEMGVSQNGWFITIIIEIHDLEVPPFQETSMYIYIYIFIYIYTHPLVIYEKRTGESPAVYRENIMFIGMFIIYKWTIFQSYVQ